MDSPRAVLLLLVMLLYDLFITFAKQQWVENIFFLFDWHRLPLFVNYDRQAVLCSIFV